MLQGSSISAIPVSVLAWAAGTYLQTRLRYVAALSERAERLELEREQRDLIAAQAERTAIARELHDIVAHSVTVMLLASGVPETRYGAILTWPKKRCAGWRRAARRAWPSYGACCSCSETGAAQH